MSRRGFALLAVLWVLTALSVLGGVALAVARTGSQTTRNRILLARAGWAREACVEILLARYAQNPAVRAVDSVDLGRGTWCRVTLEDPAAKLNLNLGSREQLVAVLNFVSRVSVAAVDSLADALLDYRDPDTIPRPFGAETATNRNGPLADVAELAYVRGFDSSLVDRLTLVLTTRGPGVINVNAAPPEVLATLPGMTDEAIRVLLGGRASGRPIRSADDFAALLSKSARSALLTAYPDFVRAATFAPAQLVARVEGGVRGTPIVARATLTLVPLPDRLAVIRRETE